MKNLLIVTLILTFGLVGCKDQRAQAAPKSSSGVTKANVVVKKGSDGLTIEQRNVAKRLLEDNKIGSTKHLYVLSAYSGDVIIYSTVQGKVTSGGKRLTPKTVVGTDGQYVGRGHMGVPLSIGGRKHYTSEVIQDDGTYGSSNPYIFWWDAKGTYHQHFISGGQIVHVASEPLSVNKVMINIDSSN